MIGDPAGWDHKDDGDPGPARRKASAADLIVRLAMERYELGRAEDGEPFAIDRTGPNVARMFRGGRASLRSALASTFADQFGRVPPAQALVDALAVLEGRALGAPRQVVPLRAVRLPSVGAESPSTTRTTVILDMGDEAGRAIEIDSAGWRVLPRSPITFRRSELIGALPAPVPGSLDPLRALLNIDPDDLSLVLAQQAAALLGVPCPIVLYRGPAGAAKTSAARIHTLTLDPSPAQVRSVPKDPEAWAVTAAGSLFVALDNIDLIPGWLSDALCRAVTGEGYLRRALYTDGAITVLTFRRAIVITAIDPGAMRGDLSDRLVAVDLEPIDERDRLEQEDLDAAVREAHPRILGALLDLTSTVLRTMAGIRLPRRPRMADYGRVVAAIDAELGTDGFARYMTQRGNLQREAAEGDPIGAAILAFMATREEWASTAAELLDAITPEKGKPKDWPSTPRGLSGALRRVGQPLEAAGIRVTFAKEGHGNRRIIRLEGGGREPSAPSARPNPSVKPADGADANADDADGRTPSADPNRPHLWAVPEHDAVDANGADGRSAAVLGQDDHPRSARDPLVRADDPQAETWLDAPFPDAGGSEEQATWTD
jgi:hypothetical protein